MNFRIGNGYDIHELVPGRKLILGGVHIPFERGLLGHSDGDALLHAISDAMLGALSLGDIGRHFPDTDPSFKGADSLILLKKVYDLIKSKGFSVVNIDTNIVAERPKMLPHVENMKNKISEALNIEKDCVSVKARTNEGLDSIGEGRAIAVYASVLLCRG